MSLRSVLSSTSACRLWASRRGYSSPSSSSSSDLFPSREHTHGTTPTAKVKNQHVTLDAIYRLYRRRIPITLLTAFDYASARTLAMSANVHASQLPASTSGINATCGIDICLVGDSLAMVALGYSSTTQLPFEEFVYHAAAVRRGLDSVTRPTADTTYKLPWLVADLPFGSYEVSVSQGVQSAIQLVQRAQVDAIKLEGGSEHALLISTLASKGIPVMGHVGLTPQRTASLSGYKVQGKTVKSALKVLEDAMSCQQAGACMILLEAIPPKVAHFITSKLQVPTIGIGAGSDCSGQVLVYSDMLGLLDGKRAKFVEEYMNTFEQSTRAISQYSQQVKTRQFPKLQQHTYDIDDEVWSELVDKHGWN